MAERIQDDNDYEPLVQNSVPFHAGSNEKFDASCGFLSFMPDKGNWSSVKLLLNQINS